jgi:hypothetical protein
VGLTREAIDDERETMIPGSDRRDQNQGRGTQWLDRAAAAVSEDASCVGPWRADRLCAEAGPGVTPADVRRALERNGVRVADLPRLPVQPPGAIAAHPEFADLLTRLGRKLSAELVFGSGLRRGFRVLKGLRLEDGRRLNGEVIEEAREQTPTGALHADWSHVLSILADAAQDPGALDAISLWEVVTVLRSLAGLGYSHRALTVQAAGLSLEHVEAEVLAAAVAEEYEILESQDAAVPTETEPPVPAAARSTVVDAGGEPYPPAAGRAVPTEPLQPVLDMLALTIRNRTDIVQLSWSPPPTGVVSLRIAAEPPRWDAGTVIGTRDADSYGRPLSAAGVPGPDRRMTHELALPPTRAFVTPMTVRDTEAAVGRYVEVTKGAPVRDLSARRFGEEVRLTWTWPDEAIAVHVAWQSSAAPDDEPVPSAGRQQRIWSRRAFDAEGGFAAVMGYAAQRVEVWAVIPGPDGEQITAPAETEVPAAGIPVNYDVQRVPGFSWLLCLVRRQRRRKLRVWATQRCVLPDLIVVESRRPGIPLAPNGGVPVARIPGRPMDPGTSMEFVVELGAEGPSWLACFVDPAKPTAARSRVTLIPPPVARLWVR